MLIDEEEDYLHSAAIKEGLWIENPEAQIGLLDCVPEDAMPEKIVNAYHSKDNWVRCAVCRTDKKHKKGITIELAEGLQALCGNKCAEQFFGAGIFNRLEKNFEYAKRNALLKNLIQPAAKAAKITLSRIEGLWLDLERQISEFVSEVKNACDLDFEQELKNGQFARIEIRTREVQRLSRDGVARTVRETYEEPLYVVQASELFARRRRSLDSICQELRQLIRLLEKEPETNAEISGLNKIRLEIADNLELALSVFPLAKRFFTAENLEVFSKWIKYKSNNIKKTKIRKDRYIISDSEFEYTANIPSMEYTPNVSELVSVLRDVSGAQSEKY